MAEKGAETPNFDPMRAWREWFVKNERDWSEAMTGFMKNEEVSQAIGKEINATMFRQQMMSDEMSGAMAMMNLPTRNDVLALGERIGRLEDAVARIEAALTLLQEAQPPRPQRTRKPPSKKEDAAK